MSFTRLIVRNLFRQRARTLLTVLGISLGIMTVCGAGVITGAFDNGGEIAHVAGADIIVRQKGSADLTFSTCPRASSRSSRARTGLRTRPDC